MKKSLLNLAAKDKCFFKAIHEIVHNIRVKKRKLKPSQKKLLNKHARFMKKVLLKPKSKRSRALLVRQSGGFWPVIIPLLTTVVSKLIEDAIRKKGNPSAS